MIIYFLICRTGPIQRHRLCFAGGWFWPLAFFLFCDDNVDGDVDGHGHGEDDDAICVTRRTLELSCNGSKKGRRKCTHDSCSVKRKGII